MKSEKITCIVFLVLALFISLGLSGLPFLVSHSKSSFPDMNFHMEGLFDDDPQTARAMVVDAQAQAKAQTALAEAQLAEARVADARVQAAQAQATVAEAQAQAQAQAAKAQAAKAQAPTSSDGPVVSSEEAKLLFREMRSRLNS